MWNAALGLLGIGSSSSARIAAGAGRSEEEEEAHMVASSSLLPSGIYNQGNSCFLNALLQTLAASPRMVTYFHRLVDLLDQQAVYTGQTSSSSSQSLSHGIGDAVFRLQVGGGRRSRPLDLSSLQRRIQSLFPQQQSFVGDDQQDADEVLLILLDKLEKEGSVAWRTLAPKLHQIGMEQVLSLLPPQSTAADPWWGSSQSTTTTTTTASPLRHVVVPLANPLLGSLFLLLQCTRCGRKSPLRPDPFSVLPVQAAGDNLLQCLEDFCKPESITGYDCLHCHARTRAVKREVIGKLPPVLCIKILRNQFVNGRMVKNRQTVHLPDVLDLKPACFFHILAAATATAKSATTGAAAAAAPPSPWKQTTSTSRRPVTSHVLGALGGNLMPPTSSHESNTEYRLSAVVEHEGGAYGGHFVAYRRLPGEAASWLRCSDERVTVVDSLQGVQAYLCLYERRIQ